MMGPLLWRDLPSNVPCTIIALTWLMDVQMDQVEDAVQPQQQQHQQEWFDVMEEIAVGGLQAEPAAAAAEMPLLEQR